MGHRRSTLRLALLMLGLAGAWLLRDAFPLHPVPEARKEGVPAPDGGEAAVLKAFRARRSDLVAEVQGAVARVLPDDREGTPHQRFVLELPSGHTLLVSHNLGLAPRVEGLAPGANVRVRGEYEWNDRGGVLHWTHHDPAGRREGGWIPFAGRRFE
jgi:hypothetical protein